MAAESSHGAMFRYWVDAALPMSREGGLDAILKDLEGIAANGYAGIELCTLMKGGEQNLDVYGWATPKFVEMLKAILKKANALGLRVDMTATGGWPIMLPGIGDSNAREQELFYGGVTAPFTGSTTDTLTAGSSGKALEAVTAVKVTGSVTVDKGAQTFQWGTDVVPSGVSSKQTTLVDPDRLLVLEEGTDYTYDDAAGTVALDWTAPADGTWVVRSYWRGYSSHTVTGGSSQFGSVDGTTYYTNYLSRDGARAYIDYMEEHFFSDRELTKLLARNGTQIFEDSLEFGNYFGESTLQWTREFREQWQHRLGYDVTPYLPLLQGIQNGGAASVEYCDYEFPAADGGYSNTADRLRNDYKQMMTELFIDQHITPIQTWLARKGLGYKFQTYSFSFDTPAVAASVGQPEVETLGFSNLKHSEDKMRLMTGGASSGGSRVLSSEVALNMKGYQTTYASAMQTVGQQYGLGMNDVFWHGFASTAASQTDAWPGWSVFGTSLGDYWGPRQTTWDTERDFGDYLARTQQVLQEGERKVDLAILTDTFGTHTPIWEDDTLADAGFSYEYVTANTLALPTATVRKGLLNPDHAGYKALVVAADSSLDLATARRLIDFSRRGLPVILVGDLPEHVSSWAEYLKGSETKLQRLVQTLARMKNVTRVADEAGVLGALDRTRVQANARFADPAHVLVHARQAGSLRYYYLYNDETEAVDLTVTLKGSGAVADINAWTGAITQRADFTANRNGTVTLDVALDSQASTLLAVGRGTPVGAYQPLIPVTPVTADDSATVVMSHDRPVLRSTTGGTHTVTTAKGPLEVEVGEVPDAIRLETGWSLSVERWQQGSGVAPATSTIDVGDTDLVAWSAAGALGNAVSGVGTYTTTVELPSAWGDVDGAVLSFAGLGARGTEVFVNGRKAPFDQEALTADVSGLIVPGTNTVRVVVRTTLGNQMIADGTLAAPVWSGIVFAPAEYGIIGAPTLTPYTDVALPGLEPKGGRTRR